MKIFLSVWLVLFLLVSTHYLPAFFASKLEKSYPVFDANGIDSSKQYYIVVLGSGYNADQRLPAIGQLELVSLSRLAEGIRIKNDLSHAFLVCSGYSAFGIISQASTSKKAAVELGVNSEEILVMETPRTTWEEAKAFSEQFGKQKHIILVTDAIHMKRAKSFFEKFELQVIPAPTNFRVKYAANDKKIKFLPSISNVQLMDYVLHEYLGEWKSKILQF